MYGDTMQRTQIYLDEEESRLLGAVSARTGASRSELIRRAVRAQYGDASPERRLAALRESSGIWADRELTGDEYVQHLREPVSERLADVGLS
jgi:Arc/MetJ-type ribon-helix-helix transcriptional regulator